MIVRERQQDTMKEAVVCAVVCNARSALCLGHYFRNISQATASQYVVRDRPQNKPVFEIVIRDRPQLRNEKATLMTASGGDPSQMKYLLVEDKCRVLVQMSNTSYGINQKEGSTFCIHNYMRDGQWHS